MWLLTLDSITFRILVQPFRRLWVFHRTFSEKNKESSWIYLYVEGETCEKLSVEPLKSPYTVTHEVILNPGEQYTLYPDTLHWFKAGEEGAVISEFSAHSDDASDIFTDPKIVR